MRYSDIAGAALALLIACCNTSVGSDNCTGERTRCAPGEITRQQRRLPSPGGIADRIESSKLPELTPTWQHALTFVPAPPPIADSGGSSLGRAGRVAGTGRAGLWYVRTRSTSEGVEIYRLDQTGEPLDSTVIRPPASDSRAQHAAEPSTFEGYAQILNDEGPAPILLLSWTEICANCKSSSSNEVVALEPELHDRPLRVEATTMRWPFPDTARQVPSHATRSEDGGLWLFSDSLRKYDAHGALLIRQTLIDWRAWPAPTIRGGRAGEGFHSEALIALGASQAPHVYAFGGDGFPQLWWLDADGNVQGYYEIESSWDEVDFADRGDVTLLADREGRAVAFVETTQGDLLVYRLDAAGAESTAWQLARQDFRSLAPVSASEDEAGNLYVLSVGGGREAPVPTLCQLPLSGSLRCYALRGLAIDDSLEYGVYLAGGAEGVVYLDHLANVRDVPNARETLARFELP